MQPIIVTNWLLMSNTAKWLTEQ